MLAIHQRGPRVDSSYPGVIPHPHIVGPVRLSGRDATLTLVTDGVSDRLSDDAVAQILRDTCPEPHLGPKALLVAALDAGAVRRHVELVETSVGLDKLLRIFSIVLFIH